MIFFDTKIRLKDFGTEQIKQLKKFVNSHLEVQEFIDPSKLQSEWDLYKIFICDLSDSEDVHRSLGQILKVTILTYLDFMSYII